MKKAFEILKNIFSIIGLACIAVLGIIVFWRLKNNEKNSHNINPDDGVGYLDSLLDNRNGDNTGIDGTINRVNDNNNRIGEGLDRIESEIDKRNKKDKDRLGKLKTVRNRLERLIERIREEGITRD